MAKRKKKLPVVPFTVGIDSEQILEAVLANLDFDQIHEFIVRLDKECQDWGVTEKLYKHFKKEMLNMPHEEAKASGLEIL